MEDIASDLQCAADTKSIILQTETYQKKEENDPRMVGVMDQDMKSYSLDARLGHKEFTSGPFQAIKRGTIQLPIAISNTVCICSTNCQRARKSNVCARLLNTSSYSTDTVCIERNESMHG